ncbi:MAG: plasmid mobilization relaxosome protein MobC [Oscillospiraceae bacterium]|jgi:CRISPR/Cas system-associated exonuclease Cas4 (RecB family)|nr:plasmid mobilization relaxosome protein MobC [Oscillospiraceae bacterium]
MTKKTVKRKRQNQIIFRLDDIEMTLFEEKMKSTNACNREAYIRKMVLDGQIIHVEFAEIREMVRLLRSSANNLNQIAKRANETRNIYESDVVDLQENYEKLLNFAKEFYAKMVDL